MEARFRSSIGKMATELARSSGFPWHQQPARSSWSTRCKRSQAGHARTERSQPFPCIGNCTFCIRGNERSCSRIVAHDKHVGCATQPKTSRRSSVPISAFFHVSPSRKQTSNACEVEPECSKPAAHALLARVLAVCHERGGISRPDQHLHCRCSNQS